MRRSVLLGLAAAVVLSVATVAVADGLRWKLGFQHETPAWVKIPRAGSATRVVWYASWEVENKTGDVRKPAVQAKILTDTEKTFPDTADPGTVTAVKKLTGAETLATTYDLRRGVAKDATVKGISTFGAVDDLAKKLELRVYGLMDPVTMVNGKKIHEVIYWSAKYERKGDEFGRTEDAWKKVSEGWVTESSEVLPDVQK